ncbi:hypothetical protein Ndes2526A_g07195 [Nannochloris sp. 'desiccata']
MPKLREYVQGPGHDISFSSLKPVATVPTPGCQYSGGQLVKLKLDATSGQQTRQEEPTRAVAEEHFSAASKKLHDAYSKREYGGDRVFENTGQSFRYGLNVSPAIHFEYLQQAQLEPEIDEKGEVRGFNPNAIDPMRDPEHALNSFYKEKAKAVFDDKRGRLL